jgi:hypothetical protein
MRQPIKPKKPKKAQTPIPCSCRNGKVKEWDDGPYPNYDWVTCGLCKGTCSISADTQNRLNTAAYEQALTRYEYAVQQHRILRQIRLTREQVAALSRYGLPQFVKDYIATKEKQREV